MNKVLIPQAVRPLLTGTAEHGRAAFPPGQQTKGAVPVVPEADATSAGSHENVNLHASTSADLNPPHRLFWLDDDPETYVISENLYLQWLSLEHKAAPWACQAQTM